jgi:acyl-CoA thioesterase
MLPRMETLVFEAPPTSAFDAALKLDPGPLGHGLIAHLPEAMSNGPKVMEALKGGPNGGYLAAVAIKAARQGLTIAPPERTVSVRYVARPEFAPVILSPELLRGGRTTAFTRVTAEQAHALMFTADVTFGSDAPASAEHRPERPFDPAPPETLAPLAPLPGVPHFTDLVDYRWAGGGVPFSGGDEAVIRIWMRVNDGEPLDAGRLAFLLDAIFPSFYAVLRAPAPAATVDLRYDFARAITPDLAQDGWALFEFRTRDWAGGWAVEDGAAWSRSGALLAVARQLRKAVAKMTALA